MQAISSCLKPEHVLLIDTRDNLKIIGFFYYIWHITELFLAKRIEDNNGSCGKYDTKMMILKTFIHVSSIEWKVVVLDSVHELYKNIDAYLLSCYPIWIVVCRIKFLSAITCSRLTIYENKYFVPGKHFLILQP